jgi:hypothetical protein
MDKQNEELKQKVKRYLINLSETYNQPSGVELLEELEEKFGWKVRLDLRAIIDELLQKKLLTRNGTAYFETLMDPNYEYCLERAYRNDIDDERFFISTLDILLHEGQKYKYSKEFSEMISFMARFKRYSPYNNMLVKIQNPSCGFYASQHDWYTRFQRQIKEDATPMLILAPMQPVMLVYDLDSTEGPELPKHLLEFAHFDGEWDSRWLSNLTENAKKYLIRINFKKHSSSLAGFATIDRGHNEDKMRISIHEELDDSSRFGVLCHEVAHIFLGHLGSDQDRWWPSRLNLNHDSVEIEAEAVAYIVTHRLGLRGSSAAYISPYMKNDKLPEGVSIDYIAKIAGKIEEMTQGKVADPKRRTQKK